jgi:alpha-galactosidase
MTTKSLNEELARAEGWFAACFESGDAAALPFSFVYDGQPAAAFLAGCTVTRTARTLDAQRRELSLTYADSAGGLVLRCVAVRYADFPVIEWTLYFRNDGPAEAPLLADIQALDTVFVRGDPAQREFLLHHWRGDSNTPDSYQPLQCVLGQGAEQRLASVGGRPTNGRFPYFNLEWGDQGALIAIGWPGQWAARFARDSELGLRVTGGQELTHFRLRPGEEARSPLIAVMFWDGAGQTAPLARAQNLWRRWLLAYNLPRPAGLPAAPLSVVCAEGFYDFMDGPDEMRAVVDTYRAQGLPVDLVWRDAGWYPCRHWTETGTWQPDPARFPNGFKPFSDYVHALGLQFIVWFEPERVAPGTWLWDNRPEWLLEAAPSDAGARPPQHRWRLFDLGNPAALAWMIEQVDRLLVEGGIDHYRQDFNMDPLPYWRAQDAPDRQGMTENHYVTGYLAYWDELLARHPGMLIDSCASGGRRNDLETVRRSLPLLRSDYQSFAGDPSFAAGNQGHTYGLSAWLPYYGQGVYYGADLQYVARSHLSPLFSIGCDTRRDDIDWPLVRKLMGDWRRVATYMLGDYYPLTAYSLDERDWIAWQFDSPEAGEGMLQAFRRPRSPFETARFPLQALDPEATYEVVNLDAPDPAEHRSGRVLLEVGLAVTLGERPQSAIYVYRRIGG